MTKGGYKNPPKEYQFKKGKSGNPKGRPRKKKQPSSDLNLDIMESLHRELSKTISVQENGQHRVITKLDAIFAQLVAQSVHGKPSQQKILLGLLTQGKHQTTVQETLEQLQSYDEDLVNDLYDQLDSMSSDKPEDGDSQSGDGDD